MSHKCSAGLERLCITPDGSVYPCQSFIDEQFLLGNICDPNFQHARHRLQTFFRKRHVDNLSPCQKCFLKAICSVSFDCASHSFYDLGDFNRVDLQTCQAGLEVQTLILEKLIQQANKLNPHESHSDPGVYPP